MPYIYPFKGWRYNKNLITDLSAVIAPPYDVITKAMQDQLYTRHPHNFVRLILNKAPGDDRYKESARVLADWKSKGVVMEDSEETIYLLSQSYEQNGRPIKRVGIIAELELEELGQGVLPHEQTIEKHIEDRFRLMAATSTNPGQIFMTYRDKTLVVEAVGENLFRTTPMIDVVSDDNIRYQLWSISDPEQIRAIQNVLANTRAIIADGHHRYKTALRYAKEHPYVSGSERVMATLVNAYNPGMEVLPTHRLVKDCDWPIKKIIKSLEQSFWLKTYSSTEKLLKALQGQQEANSIQLGFFHRGSNRSLLLTFKPQGWQPTPFGDRSEAYQHLDVVILHHHVLKQVLNLDATVQKDLNRLAYLRGNTSPLEQLKSRSDYDVACFVKPPDINTIFTVAEAGETLPQKSTFFYPKIYSGLVFRCFGD